jgi:K+-transporting ATPase ATPase C chain
MLGHLRSSLLLLVLTVLVCCVLYPLIVWGIGHAFPEQAKGSILLKDGKPVGSRLIAQRFTGDEYFWPRPSFAGSLGYDASASGASNWGASNPKLRDRVARTLGPIVRYRSGEKPDVGAWLTPERVCAWAEQHPEAATWWFEADKTQNEKLLAEWQKSSPKVAADWKKANPDKGEPADLAVAYFAFYAAQPRDKWPQSIRETVQSVFFDAWLADNPGADLEPVPADMVMASGSGLDPHITFRNARYQVRRVAEARAKKTVEAEEKKEGKSLTPARKKEIEDRTLRQVEQLVEEKAQPLMGGLAVAGPEKLVNVLELNLALDTHLPAN